MSIRTKLGLFGSCMGPLALLTTVALAGCALDRPGPLVPDGEPVLSFSYGGPVSGPWRAEGTVHAPSAGTTTWAAANWDGSDLSVQAQRKNDHGSVDWVRLTFTRSDAGVVLIEGGCYEPVGCPGATIAFGLRSEPGIPADLTCQLFEGTLRLNTVTPSRARGTFEGTGACFAPMGVILPSFTISGGSFDVPLR